MLNVFRLFCFFVGRACKFKNEVQKMVIFGMKGGLML